MDFFIIRRWLFKEILETGFIEEMRAKFTLKYVYKGLKYV